MFGGLMMRLVSLALTIAALAATPLSASATGGVWCDGDDADLAFHFSAASSRDGSGAWFNIDGSLKIKAPGALPPAVAEFRIRDADLSERWWDDKDVRLKIDRIGTESQNFASVQMISIATSVDEAEYRGRYDLRLTLPDGTILHREGAVTCSSD